jgi:hypothetical protein
MIASLLDGMMQAFAPAHLLAILAAGLLAGQGAKRFPAAPIAACAFGLAVGSILIAAALRVENAAPILIAIASLAGIAVAAALPVPAPAQVIAAAATGGLLALDSAPQAIRIPLALAAQTGTAAAALAVLTLTIMIATRATRPWQHVALRIAGSWIAASAILALALRLAR